MHDCRLFTPMNLLLVNKANSMPSLRMVRFSLRQRPPQRSHPVETTQHCQHINSSSAFPSPSDNCNILSLDLITTVCKLEQIPQSTGHQAARVTASSPAAIPWLSQRAFFDPVRRSRDADASLGQPAGVLSLCCCSITSPPSLTSPDHQDHSLLPCSPHRLPFLPITSLSVVLGYFSRIFSLGWPELNSPFLKRCSRSRRPELSSSSWKDAC
jgi:hypothetical protein